MAREGRGRGLAHTGKLLGLTKTNYSNDFIFFCYDLQLWQIKKRK